MRKAWHYLIDGFVQAEVIPASSGWDWALIDGSKKGHAYFRGNAIRAAQNAAEKAYKPLPAPPIVKPPVVTKPTWPNAPGWPLILDADCSTFQPDFTVQWNERGLVTVERDDAAPCSPPGVLQFKYPVGFSDGAAPGTPLRVFASPVHQVYVAAWVKFGAGWQGHQGSGTSKILYVFSEGDGSMFLALYGPSAGPYELRMYPQFLMSDQKSQVLPLPLRRDQYGQDAYLEHGWLLSNVQAVPIRSGEWFLVEVCIDARVAELSQTQWFLNGKQLGHYVGIAYPPDGLTRLNLAPVFGGNDGDTKKQDDYCWFDHILIQGK